MPALFDRRPCLAGALSLLLPVTALAWGSDRSNDEIALDLVNPVSGLFAVRNDFEFTGFQGDLPGADDQERKAWDIEVAYPWTLSNGKNLVLRASFPMNQGEPTYVTPVREYAEFLIRQRADVLPRDRAFIEGHSFLDDVEIDVAYGSTNSDGLMTMFGAVTVLPSSQDGSIERDQYLLGPQVAIGRFTDRMAYGIRAQHLISVADRSSNDMIDYDTSETRLKFFYAWGFGNGWQLISNPTVIYDWEGASSNKLLLPLGLGVAKTAKFGRVPVRFEFEVQKYVASPDAFGPDWLLRFNITPVLFDRGP